MIEIRKATADDLEIIRTWLQQEKDEGHDSFIVNFSMIAEGQSKGWLTVLAEDIPIAFALGDANLSILAVKRDRRRSNVGRTLAERWFQDARERDLIGIDGECSPKTSLPFWRRMGCTQVRSISKNPWVIMPFVQSHELPQDRAVDSLAFELRDPDGKAIPGWDVVKAAVIADDDYMLARDFIAYVPETDARLTILGEELFRHVKVRDVEDIGGERDGAWIRVRNLPPT